MILEVFSNLNDSMILWSTQPDQQQCCASVTAGKNETKQKKSLGISRVCFFWKANIPNILLFLSHDSKKIQSHNLHPPDMFVEHSRVHIQT